MMLGNACPGEEGRVARVAKGENPARSKEFGMIQVHATGEAWLGFQMLQTSTKTPVLEPNYLVPNWARFFVINAHRSRADPKATVADRLNWAKLSTKTHRAGVNYCVQLALPFYVTDEKLGEVQDPSSGWSRQSHGASVTALHSSLEGHQLLTSNPPYGGCIKQNRI
eukprot:4203305-Pyramimonas_sp.AAC.1